MAYTLTLEVEAESLVKVVEKAKDKLPSEDFNYTDLNGVDLKGAKGLSGTRLTHTQQRLEKKKEKKND